jgi:catalase
MVAIGLVAAVAACVSIVNGACPYMDNDARDLPASHPPVRRDATATDEFLSQYEIDDTDVYMTSDVGGQIADQDSLSAGERGPTLLEDYIFRQKVAFGPVLFEHNIC